jgi:hypothetical protein
MSRDRYPGEAIAHLKVQMASSPDEGITTGGKTFTA